MNRTEQKRILKQRRKNRTRAKITGTTQRPRLSVHKSNRYMQAQIIDDTKRVTLLAGTTAGRTGKKVTTAQELGLDLGKRAMALGVTTVVFDRGGFRYTGRVAALAEAARKAGLIF